METTTETNKGFYDNYPTLPNFRSVYEQYAEHNGKGFDILGRSPAEDEGRDDTYVCKLSTGELINAWPEEIFPCLSEDKLPTADEMVVREIPIMTVVPE